MSSSNIKTVPRIPESIDFPTEESKILSLWDELDAFHTSLEESKNKPRFAFYDGPPFATGLPHYGHILAGTIKDVVTRYAHQRGHHVERRFGWDCHGIPIEFEIDKTLGIKGAEDVHKMGVDKYNSECRKIVTRYVQDWKVIMNRIGRWVDFENDYKTLYPWFMESVWWVFKELFLKGLVYHGNKIMPYSTACHTPLSNFESGQNYKDVMDPAVTISLPIIGDAQGAVMLIWTTTPWTLPSNLAACVNAKLIYARIKETSTQNLYVLLKSRADSIFKPGTYIIIEEFLGETLKGLQYEPIFPYYSEMVNKGAFRVLTDDYVNAESGTGIVHQAPYFGEDDFRVCLAAGIITRDQVPLCPIDPDGCLMKPIVDFEGQYFKDADKNIIAALKKKNRVVSVSQVKHSYPFCWRSDTPLIYKAIPSWFVRVQHMSELLREVSSKTYWVPEFVKEKRFGNWLKEARDWAISRNRYWGTPIPIWMSQDGEEVCCIGSIAELEELTGTKITDLHCESIDHLLIPSRRPGHPPLHRIPEVFDCWFESGSMPYAQHHFPFENHQEFHSTFPADFIAEGIDQTRGWFYTLLVISTALFGKAPYKNLIASGLILASDGQKMSKRKKNYPDPGDVIEKYGADALRLYLINSPVVRAENLRFKEEGVRDVIKDVFLPWFNAFRFLMQSIEGYGMTFKYDSRGEISNVMDRWILSFTQSLLGVVNHEMGRYRLYNVVPRLVHYFDHLTNWYVRMNRKRLKGETNRTDCTESLTSLFTVLLTVTRIMAPFVPFFSEFIYQHLRGFTNLTEKSVHFLMFPDVNYSVVDVNVERTIARLQAVVDLGRIIRDKKVIPMKYPLPELIVVHQQAEYLDDIKSLEDYILSEMNVRKLTVTSDKERFGIRVQVKPDHRVLGKREDYKKLVGVIENLSFAQILDLEKNGSIEDVKSEFVRFSYKTSSADDGYGMEAQNELVVLLDVNPDQTMKDEGTAREIINRIQKLRKAAHLVPSDQITVYYQTELGGVAQTHANFIEKSIKAKFLPGPKLDSDEIILEENKDLKGCALRIQLTEKQVAPLAPLAKWVNVLKRPSEKALILLEAANVILTFQTLVSEIQTVFNFPRFTLWTQDGDIKNDEDVSRLLTGETIFVVHPADAFNPNDVNLISKEPYCKVFNFVEDGVAGTIVLENPAGVVTVREKDYGKIIQQWIKSK